MWKAYSAGYIRHNKTGNIFVMTISLAASGLLSMVSGVFYNFWMDQVSQSVAATGSARVETTPAIAAYIIVFSCASLGLVMMIHHAFAATMTNRIHQLGILQSIGATPRQIKGALILEILVVSAPAIFAGNLLGILLCWGFMETIFTLTAGLRTYDLAFTYAPAVLLGSLFFSLLTAYLSAWLPAGKLSRISPMEAIRSGDQPQMGHVRRYRLFCRGFGVHGELARKSLYVRRKAMRVGTVSIFLAVFSCVSLLNILGISNLSTQKTYFDRFRDKWDFLITAENGEYGEALLYEIQKLDGVESCTVHRTATGTTVLPAEQLSEEVLGLGMENLNSSFVPGESGGYCVQVPIYVLDDTGFANYCGTDAQAAAVNVIWDSVHSERTGRQYVPFLKGGEVTLTVDGQPVFVSEFTPELPKLREEFRQYALSLVMSERGYQASGLNLPLGNPIFTVRVTQDADHAAVHTALQQLLTGYPGLALEGRLEEEARENQIQQGLRFVICMFTGLMACVGLANVFASTLGQLHLRKREFARYFSLGLTPKGAAKILAWEAAIVALRPILLTILINIPLMALMLDAGGISAEEFILERLPLAPALTFFAGIIGFVALAYYLGGRKICSMSLAETIKNDTLMM